MSSIKMKMTLGRGAAPACTAGDATSRAARVNIEQRTLMMVLRGVCFNGLCLKRGQDVSRSPFQEVLPRQSCFNVYTSRGRSIVLQAPFQRFTDPVGERRLRLPLKERAGLVDVQHRIERDGRTRAIVGD